MYRCIDASEAIRSAPSGSTLSAPLSCRVHYRPSDEPYINMYIVRRGVGRSLACYTRNREGGLKDNKGKKKKIRKDPRRGTARW